MILYCRVKRDEFICLRVCFLYFNENDKRYIKGGRNFYWDCNLEIDFIYMLEIIYDYYVIDIYIICCVGVEYD